MGYFYTYDIIAVLPGYLSCQLTIHILRVLFISAAPHARSNDIQEGQHPCPGIVDHLLLKYREITPAGRAGIDDRRDTRAEGKPIRTHPSQTPSVTPPTIR